VANEVISYLEMCSREGTSLQRGINFGLGGDHSVVLMSVRPNAPYRDRLEDEGRRCSRWARRAGRRPEEEGRQGSVLKASERSLGFDSGYGVAPLSSRRDLDEARTRNLLPARAYL
jgi:hypothetical protein